MPPGSRKSRVGTESGGGTKDSVMYLIKILPPLNSISNNMDNHKNHIKFIRGEMMAPRRRGQRTTCTTG